LPLEDRVPLLVPVEQGRRLPGPEALVVLVGLVVEVGAHHQRVPLEALRRREGPVLDQVVLDGGAGRLVGHGRSPSGRGSARRRPPYAACCGARAGQGRGATGRGGAVRFGGRAGRASPAAPDRAGPTCGPWLAATGRSG